MTSIMRQIVSLNADPMQGRRINHGGDSYECAQGNIFMQYDIFQGAVLINYLQIHTTKPDERFGLYPVSWRDRRERWEPSETPKTAIEKTHQWKSKSGKANYAAVSGRFGDIFDAGRLLHEHLIGAYRKADYLTSSDALASIMQQSSASELPVNWLVHDAGTDTFKAAARILSQKPLADAQARAKDKKAGTIQAQNVYFSNPNTSSIKGLEKLCQQAGLNYVGMHTNNRDLRQFRILKNVGMELGKSVAKGVGAGGSVSVVSLGLGQIGAGSARKVIDNGIDALINGNHLMAAATIVTSGFICLGIYKKSQTIAAGVRCTFGNGNQKWYTSDADLAR